MDADKKQRKERQSRERLERAVERDSDPPSPSSPSIRTLRGQQMPRLELFLEQQRDEDESRAKVSGLASDHQSTDGQDIAWACAVKGFI